MTPFQTYDVMVHTKSSAVCEKMDPQPEKNNLFDIFIRFKLGGAFTLQPRLNLAPCTFWLFSKFKELLARWKCTRVQDLSKAVRHFRAHRYTSFGVPVRSTDVAEAARKVCGQWREVP